MAYDESGNWQEDQPQGPYKPSDDEWNRASTILNQYNDKAGGDSINWDNARKKFEEQAAGGGNFGDWVNKTFESRSGWTTPKAQSGYQAPATPTSAWNRESFRDASMARPVGMTAADFIAQNGGISGGVKMVPGSNDKVILPTGEVIDLSINANAQGQGTGNGWTGAGHWNGSSVQAYGTPGAPGAPGGGGGGPLGTAASNMGSAMSAEMTLKNQQDEALRKQLIDQLTARSQQSLTIDRNDPTIRAQADAYGANEERAKRNYLADIAEKSGPNANLQGEARMAAEKVGQRTGGFEAELMGRELTAKRTEIATALESMRGMLTTSQEMQLRKELASMDDAIQRMRLQQDATQFDANLGYKNAELAQQGSIENNRLGYQYDTFDWERSPLNPKNIIGN